MPPTQYPPPLVIDRGKITILLAISVLFVTLLIAFSQPSPYVQADQDSNTLFDSQNITNLSPENFDLNIPKGIWFVDFYAPWCPHCKRLAPTWKNLASSVSSNPRNPEKVPLYIGKVNCVAERELCIRHSIRGYPTLILFENDQMYIYQGPRNLEALQTFATLGYKTAESKPRP